jgi:hypothetical protein
VSAATPGQALSPDPADFAYHVRATAFNVLTGKMAGDEWSVPRNKRDAIARAVVDAIEPLIRADERAVAAQQPHAAPEPVQLLLGPCEAQGHDGEHLQLRTHNHWLCAITLTNMLVAADVIADPAPDVTKLRAELDEEQGYRSELTNDILLNAPESFDGDEAADVIAVRYVRHLEAEIAKHAEPQPAPELAGAMAALIKVVASHERVMYAAAIDIRHGQPGAARRLLGEQLDGWDGPQWDGTETGAQYLERTREGS